MSHYNADLISMLESCFMKGLKWRIFMMWKDMMGNGGIDMGD